VSEVIKLAAVGDIALSHEYNNLLISKDSSFPFENVRSYFNEHDIVVANLEAPFCKTGKTYPLKCSLRADPEYLYGLIKAGIDIVSLANNHILDYREDAFFETIFILKKSPLDYFGAGKNLSDARQPLIKEISGIKIGFLGYCAVNIDSPFYASSEGRGIAPLILEYLEADIVELKKHVDVVIITLHWGIENCSYPTPLQQKQARQILRYGADLILGHHPHVLQGLEKYENGYIAYSLGNFIFSDIDWSWINSAGNKMHSKVILTKKNRETMILSATIGKEGVKEISCSPCFIDGNGQVQLLDQNHPINKQLKKLSAKLYCRDYSLFWLFYNKLREINDKIKTFGNKFKKIYKLRPHHVGKFIKYISR